MQGNPMVEQFQEQLVTKKRTSDGIDGSFV